METLDRSIESRGVSTTFYIRPDAMPNWLQWRFMTKVPRGVALARYSEADRDNLIRVLDVLEAAKVEDPPGEYVGGELILLGGSLNNYNPQKAKDIDIWIGMRERGALAMQTNSWVINNLLKIGYPYSLKKERDSERQIKYTILLEPQNGKPIQINPYDPNTHLRVEDFKKSAFENIERHIWGEKYSALIDF